MNTWGALDKKLGNNWNNTNFYEKLKREGKKLRDERLVRCSIPLTVFPWNPNLWGMWKKSFPWKKRKDGQLPCISQNHSSLFPLSHKNQLFSNNFPTFFFYQTAPCTFYRINQDTEKRNQIDFIKRAICTCTYVYHVLQNVLLSLACTLM